MNHIELLPRELFHKIIGYYIKDGHKYHLYTDYLQNSIIHTLLLINIKIVYSEIISLHELLLIYEKYVDNKYVKLDINNVKFWSKYDLP